MEYSFQNYAHLLEQPVEIADGYAYAPDVPGHGLALSDRARRELAVPDVREDDADGLPAARSTARADGAVEPVDTHATIARE